MRAAVTARRSFNLIHLETMFKIDIFASVLGLHDFLERASAESDPDTAT
jgi:hypothetical protein